MRIALLRHPPVQGMAGICYGRMDAALAPGWELVAQDWAAALADFPARALWTSPQPRCAAPAAVLASRLGLVPRPDDRLRELGFGDWEGLRWDAVDRADLDRWAADPGGFVPPGGEGGAALLARAADFAAMLRGRGEDAVVVSHGGPLRLLPALLSGGVAGLLTPAPAQGTLTWATGGGATGGGATGGGAAGGAAA